MPEPDAPHLRRAEAAARRELGLRLRDLRDAREWTLEELKDRVGISVSSLSAYELGTRAVSLWTLARICAAYDTTVAEFLLGIDPFGTTSPAE